MPRKVVYASPRMIVEYEGSLRNWAEVAMSPRILAICLEIATEDALPYAIAFSPHDEGDYVRSWEVRPATTVLRGMRRVCARLINTASHSALVEWGGQPGGGRYKGRYRPAQHVLQRVRDQIAGRGRVDPDLTEGLNTRTFD